MVRANLGVLLLITGEHARAEVLLRGVAAGYEKIEPRPEQVLAFCSQNLAAAHYGQGELSKAERYTQLHLGIMERLSDSDGILAAVSNLMTLQVGRNRMDEADGLLCRALELVSTHNISLDYSHLMGARSTIRKQQKRYRNGRTIWSRRLPFWRRLRWIPALSINRGARVKQPQRRSGSGRYW
jgi:hypothetical protein